METISDSGVAVSLLITVGLIAGVSLVGVSEGSRSAAGGGAGGPGLETSSCSPPTAWMPQRLPRRPVLHVRIVQRLDEVPVDFDAVITAITATENERVIVVTTDSGEVLAIPVGSVV